MFHSQAQSLLEGISAIYFIEKIVDIRRFLEPLETLMFCTWLPSTAEQVVLQAYTVTQILLQGQPGDLKASSCDKGEAVVNCPKFPQ